MSKKMSKFNIDKRKLIISHWKGIKKCTDLMIKVDELQFGFWKKINIIHFIMSPSYFIPSKETLDKWKAEKK